MDAERPKRVATLGRNDIPYLGECRNVCFGSKADAVQSTKGRFWLVLTR